MKSVSPIDTIAARADESLANFQRTVNQTPEILVIAGLVGGTIMATTVTLLNPRIVELGVNLWHHLTT